MSDLRETVADAIERAPSGSEYHEAAIYYRVPDRQDIEDMSDAAIAAVAEALQSEPAILAAAEALSLYEPGMDWHEVWESRVDDPVAADAADEYYLMGQDTLKSALAAIGAQPAKEDCGCTAIDHDAGAVADVTQCSAPDCPRAAKEGQGDE